MHIYNIEWWKLRQQYFMSAQSLPHSTEMCVYVCQTQSMQHSVFPVKTEWTQSNPSLILCEMSFSRHRDGWMEGRYQNLLNILQVHTPLPHSKKSLMMWKCVYEWEREIQVWQLPQWVSQDFTSWVFNCESWPFHANYTNTDTHWTTVRKWKNIRQRKKCYSSLLQQQTQTLELNVQFSLDMHQKAVSGCLYNGGQFQLTTSVSVINTMSPGIVPFCPQGLIPNYLNRFFVHAFQTGISLFILMMLQLINIHNSIPHKEKSPDSLQISVSLGLPCQQQTLFCVWHLVCSQILTVMFFSGKLMSPAPN